MSELVIGPFLGVLGGLGSERLYDWIKDRETRSKLKQSIRNELETCMSLLTGKGNLLPTTMWNSTVTSGDVKVLSFDDRKHLSSMYFEIENHNYEAKRVRDSAVVAKTGSYKVIAGGRDIAEAHWRGLSELLYKEEQSLKKKISELLKNPLWNTR